MDRKAVIDVLISDITYLTKIDIPDNALLVENVKHIENEAFTNFLDTYYKTLYKLLKSTKEINPINNERIAITLTRVKLTKESINSLLGNATLKIVNYRKKQKAIFAKYLHAADPHFTNVDILNRVSDELEQSCMEYAKFNSYGHLTCGDDICETAEFKATYSPICAEVLSYINVNSLTCQTYGRQILDNIISGKLDPKKIAFQTCAQLCPESMRREKERIEIRMNQKIDVKVSKLFKCPYCKKSESSYKEVQKRALDEPASYVCICLNPECGRPFTR